MTDNHDPETRRYNMSQIHSKNTSPEILVRKYLFSKGFRFRKHVKRLAGCPDIVLPKYKTVVFVHGCFWHMHDCGRFKWPKTNDDYWRPKIKYNVDRDVNNQKILKEQGWKVLIVWECELKKSFFPKTMEKLETLIKQGMK